jgi:hypothetical protein
MTIFGFMRIYFTMNVLAIVDDLSIRKMRANEGLEIKRTLSTSPDGFFNK